MNVRAWIAEAIGTFALIFVGVASIAVNHITDGSLGLTGIALAHGLTIAVMVSATMASSGGHINPAVTVGAWLARKIDAVNALGYVVFQVGGGILAAWLITLAMPSDALSSVDLGTPALGEGITVGQGIVMELILTFFLVFVVFGTAIDARAPKVGGLFIGLTVALDVLAGGPITGAAMNPARYMGPALVGGYLSEIWLYWVGPLAGGAIAALVYHHVLEEPGKD